MSHVLDRPLAQVAGALQRREISAFELVEEALRRHRERGQHLHAYKHFDGDGALEAARRSDEVLTRDSEPPPFCGVPVSVKDLYGMDGLPTFAGTARRLPDRWSSDAWLVGQLREQGAVLMGKTHTVELALGAVGINPHWGTPRNPWDAETHRIPGGSSCGAGVSLWEGSALVALGTDTGGSIRIPASMTGAVGHRSTVGRWPTDGVVPLSTTLDSVGGLTRSVADSVFFFGALDPAWGEPAALHRELVSEATAGFRVAVPRCRIWDDCQADIADTLRAALGELGSAGWVLGDSDGSLLDDAGDLYVYGGMAAAECRAFLDRDLPGWFEILHPIVGKRLERWVPLSDPSYVAAVDRRERMVASAGPLFDQVDVLALPTAMITPPPVADMEDPDAYIATNVAALRPTCPASMLGMCALTIPVGLDSKGMPVGLQLVAPGGRDELLLGVGLAAERVLGTAEQRLGVPPRCT